MAMTILPFFSCLILVSTDQVLSTHQSAELALDTHVQVRVNLNLFFLPKTAIQRLFGRSRENHGAHSGREDSEVIFQIL